MAATSFGLPTAKKVTHSSRNRYTTFSLEIFFFQTCRKKGKLLLPRYSSNPVTVFESEKQAETPTFSSQTSFLQFDPNMVYDESQLSRYFSKRVSYFGILFYTINVLFIYE